MISGIETHNGGHQLVMLQTIDPPSWRMIPVLSAHNDSESAALFESVDSTGLGCILRSVRRFADIADRRVSNDRAARTGS